ncbi:MAG: DUF4147 domain-containing protein [Patescibacteria group bacterium]|nr:DUF4147 domain-containing protein [Patescibacteria group bacterium]
MIIKNKKQIATTKLRKMALEIIEAGIESVLPVNLMQSVVSYNIKQKVLTVQNKKYNLKNGRIFIIGGGKAAGLMAEEAEKIIGPDNIIAGAVNCKTNDYATEKIKIIKGGHPIPNQAGVKGVEKMLALKKEYAICKDDLVICLISGGASALMPSPANGISLRNIREITKLLLISGAQIQEINTVRKHLSRIKGGQLGKFFAPATVVSLIISDVVGNDLKTIGSGPTVADTSTCKHAYKILKKYGLLKKTPKNIIAYFKKGYEGNEGEIYKPRLYLSKELNNCYNHIIGDNQLALNAMKDKANQLGLKPLIVTAEQTGDSAKAAQIRAQEIISKKYKACNVILIGGETTLKLPVNHGRGGRNQHYAAASMLTMKKCVSEWAMANVSTDGSDYLADVAGAIIDNDSFVLAKSRGIDVEKYIKRYDSNSLFKKINRSLIVTGDIGTNVGDVMVYISLQKQKSSLI